MSKVRCPACDKELSPKAIPKHTSGCSQWAAKIGVPPSEFNFDKHFKRGLFAEDLVEGVDYTQCKVCLADEQDIRKRRLIQHIKAHNLTPEEYQQQFPDAVIRLESTLERRKQTTRERYGVDNVFQSEEVKKKSAETARQKYGVDHASQAPNVCEKRVTTNLERYGHQNPFGSEEIQQQIRETNLQTYGVENPNQSPQFREKTKATNRERYGVDSLFESLEFQEQLRRVSREKYGTDYPIASEEVKRKIEKTCLERYGVSNPLLVPEIQQKAYETNLQNHGGRHSQQCPEVLAKARKTWLEKYGVDNPSKSKEVWEKIKNTWMRKYGQPFPPQSYRLEGSFSFPTKLESKVNELSPDSLVYAGDGSYWVKEKGAHRSRNPDFVLLKPVQLQAFKDGTPLNDLRTSAIVEVFGDYWHGPSRTGKDRKTHKKEVIESYKRCGIDCLVIWESEVKKHTQQVADRIERFIDRWFQRYVVKGVL